MQKAVGVWGVERERVRDNNGAGKDEDQRETRNVDWMDQTTGH